jgi:hypothetical protein
MSMEKFYNIQRYSNMYKDVSYWLGLDVLYLHSRRKLGWFKEDFLGRGAYPHRRNRGLCKWLSNTGLHGFSVHASILVRLLHTIPTSSPPVEQNTHTSASKI